MNTLDNNPAPPAPQYGCQVFMAGILYGTLLKEGFEVETLRDEGGNYLPNIRIRHPLTGQWVTIAIEP